MEARPGFEWKGKLGKAQGGFWSVLLLVRFLEAVENSLRDVYTRCDQLKDKQSLSKDI